MSPVPQDQIGRIQWNTVAMLEGEIRSQNPNPHMVLGLFPAKHNRRSGLHNHPTGKLVSKILWRGFPAQYYRLFGI